MSHVPTPTTGRPSLSARAISESVPKPPPTATSASAARAISPLRSSPIPVGTAIDTHGFAASRSLPGSSPSVTPPASCAPRHAAAITPPRPPQTTTAPARASSAPTVSAPRSWSASASPVPTTPIYGTRCVMTPAWSRARKAGALRRAAGGLCLGGGPGALVQLRDGLVVLGAAVARLLLGDGFARDLRRLLLRVLLGLVAQRE